MWKYVLLSLLLFANTNGHRWQRSSAEFATETSQNNYRLPNNTKPNSYDITIATDIDRNEFGFSGRVVIDLIVLEPSFNITIHARQLDIKTISLVNPFGVIHLNSHTHDNVTDHLVIPTQVQLEKDTPYTLTIEYSGVLRTDRLGFYRDTYINAKGETKWMAATNFEPLDARHAFPCYDEPALKAAFTIHIEHGEAYHAISNMKETRSAAVNGRVRTDFGKTPLMSTYLVAFIVSDYNKRTFEATADFPTTHRVFANDKVINHTSYALVEAITILKALENYLQVSFALPKLDQAVIPESIVGAMENYGLVTYPKKRILFDPDTDVSAHKLNVSNAIAHEFSHQWFGDLVSPKWWTYLWLNEGFATVFRTLACDLVHPQWNYFHHFVINELQPALHFDAEPEARPMTHYVEDPGAIENIFDVFTYSKAGSVIRMFMYAIGENTFKKALNYYLIRNSFGGVDEDSLFDALDTAIQEDKVLPQQFTMKKLFGSWTRQKGVPVLKVTRNYQNGTVTVYQEKYDAVFKKDEPVDKAMWWIPYNFASATNAVIDLTAPEGWLSDSERQKLIKSSNNRITWSNSDWLLFNIQQTGYYRVWYDDENYNLLRKELNDGDLNKIHPINRAQILDDLSDFVYSGRVSPKILCGTMTYLRNETAYIPWETARTMITNWNRNLQASKKLANFKNLVGSLIKPLYQKKTLKMVDREEIFDALIRNVAVSLACQFGVSQCLNDTYSEFQKYLKGSKLLPDIRGLVITNGIRMANDGEIAELWEIFLKCPPGDEREEIISAFGNIPNDLTVELYFNKTIRGFYGRSISSSERQSFVMSIIGSGQKRVEFIIQHLLGDLSSINSRIGPILNVLTAIADRILTTDMETQFYQLLDLAAENNLITNEYERHLRHVMAKRLKWQRENLVPFEKEFFAGKCTGNGAPVVKTIPFVTFVICYVTRWGVF